MILKALQFDEAGMPKQVDVSMSIEEAMAIAALFGKLNGKAHSKLGITDSDVFDCLVGDVINRYWDGGYAEVIPNFELGSLNS